MEVVGFSGMPAVHGPGFIPIKKSRQHNFNLHFELCFEMDTNSIPHFLS